MTVTSTAPDVCAGLVDVICVSLLTDHEFAQMSPNFIMDASVKAVPVMVTNVPPLVEPDVGEMLVIFGTSE